MMTNKFLYILSIVVFVCASSQAMAQRCDIDYESIVKLRDAEAGSYSIWDTVWGEQDADERFKSGVVLDNGEVLVVGQREGQTLGGAKLVVAQIKKNGRVRWKEVHEVKGLVDVVKVIKGPKHIWVIANRIVGRGRSGVWIARLGEFGKLVSMHGISDGRASLQAEDIIRVQDKGWRGAPYLLSVTKATPKAMPAETAVLYRLNAQLKVASKKAIVSGLENKVIGLDVVDGDGILATGYETMRDGRKMGWVVRLDEQGDVKWQQHYRRGAGAQLVSGKMLRSDAFVVVGTASPAVRDGKRAGWVMAVERRNGKVLWQRYFTGALEFLGRDIWVSEDGLISALLDGEEREDGLEEEHVRILTLNPRGVLFASGSYFNGTGVDAYSFILGPNRERIIVGGSDMRYQIEAVDAEHVVNGEAVEEEVKRSVDGWLAAATAVDSYEDPCFEKPFVSP